MNKELLPSTCGNAVKIFLPGESPWAEVVQELSDLMLLVRINNHLVNTGYGHPFKLGDVVRVKKTVHKGDDGKTYFYWKLASKFDPSKQKPMLDNPRLKSIWEKGHPIND